MGNEVTWWGDEQATIQYAKTNVPRIIDQFGGDPRAVFLCGFSRGAIGVNYIGLHDDEISAFWTAFITHDHFDGVKQWPRTEWGTPLATYRNGASERLMRVRGRPYLVSQNGNGTRSETYIRSVLPSVDNFTFSHIDTRAIFGIFPNQWAKHGHTDRWLLKPSKYRAATWRWINQITESRGQR
jgi:phosphoribosyl 1,2-cyclic phosphodiesterase